MASIFLAVPHHGSLIGGTMIGCVKASKDHQICIAESAFGCLTHNFNMLLTVCLNHRHVGHFTHFAMIHSDIAPAEGWLDVLMEEITKHEADVVSNVIAIRDMRGLTSTGIGTFGRWSTDRLTLKQIHELPETFGIESLTDDPGKFLAINTGLWVCDITRPWIDSFTASGQPGFHVENRFWRDDEGVIATEFRPEDWAFSEWAARHDMKVMASRRVAARHNGPMDFGNDCVYGSYTYDEDYSKIIKLEDLVNPRDHPVTHRQAPSKNGVAVADGARSPG